MHLYLIIAFLNFLLPVDAQTAIKMDYTYEVSRLKGPVNIDANWNKPQWQDIEPGVINNFMGDIPQFIPYAQFKMMYDTDNLYVIFRVEDKYVLSANENIHDPVWEDSCVEFFFSPDVELPLRYFNLEVNCAGIPLMNYNVVPRHNFVRLEVEDIKNIEIAHSIPGRVYPEITEPVTWTLEYKIPIEILKKYSKVTQPESGVIWKANFYKIAVNTSSPHYMTWAPVENEKPDFHLPRFFGRIMFK